MNYQPTKEVLAVHAFVLSERERHVKAVLGAHADKRALKAKKKTKEKVVEKRTRYFEGE